MISQSRLDSRQIALTVSTYALSGPKTSASCCRPDTPRTQAGADPVLYLLHRTSGGAADWVTLGDAEQTTAGRPLIVVMPDIGQHYDGGSYCTNWYNGGHYGQPRWETFHIDQLIPWVDHNLRTVADRDGRAIAGLSQGGFCAMSYAARHPDLFGAALSFSGVVDTAYDSVAQSIMKHGDRRRREGGRSGAEFDLRPARHRGAQLGRARPDHAGREPARDATVDRHRQRASGPA